MCYSRLELASSQYFCRFWYQQSKQNRDDEVEWKHNHFYENICQIRKTGLGKNHFNPTSFSLLWKLIKIPTFMSFLSSYEVSKQSTQRCWLSLTSFGKTEHLLRTQWLSVKLKWGRSDECQEMKHMKDIYKLIYWKEIFCYSCEIVPRTRSSSLILGPK